ncbi:MAG: DUF1302 domain-containing protein [Hahellaceae bacterium]|nr:DUF1302 domain-containing protein [Hahellaceae bacterium]MCP5169057.1 DUF1302 domain-containing protein [Hahellaceae bacterium]
MTNKVQRWHRMAQLPLATAVAAIVSAPAGAFQFYMGDVEASFDTKLTAGASWRTEDRNVQGLAPGNLAPLGNNPYITQVVPGVYKTSAGASTNNYDDGNLNFDKGDTYSQIVKGTSELMLRWENYGGFVRAKYWYDFQLKDGDMATDPAGQRRQLSVNGDKNASGAEFQDAYVWGDFEVADMPLNVRLGKQVVSWGESTFIFGGINVVNPVDVQSIRAPGAEIKDALIPVNMLYTSLGLSENITMEAFLQLDWEKTRPDDCGTFFSTNDFGSDGCGPVLLAGQLPDSVVNAQGIKANRIADQEPDDNDQFGVALRWYAQELGDTEFGLYYIRYHSRVPVISGVVANPAIGDSFPEYRMSYPEGIQLLGLSFNTSTEGGWSVGGEVSYKKDVPLQWNAFELIFGGLARDESLLLQQRIAEAGAADKTALYGKDLNGYDLYDTVQAQMTFIKFFDQVLGASRLSFVGEVGGTWVQHLPSVDQARYGRSGIWGIPDYDPTAPGITTSCDGRVVNGTATVNTNLNPANCSLEGFTTSMSWGYRMRTSLDYNDVFAGINLTPTLAFGHDVNGYAPEPAGNFQKGRKTVGLSLTGVYLNQYTASIGYTNYFGGRFNDLSDRDNLSLSVSYSF